jgi:hypothetical protein
MKLYITLIIICVSGLVFPIKPALSSYILNDIHTNLSLLHRIHFTDQPTSSWGQFSRAQAAITFPRIQSYLHLSPHLEFTSVGIHSGNTVQLNANTSRLTQAYIDLHTNMGILSFGTRRLSLYHGLWFGDNNTSHYLPRSIGHVGYAASLVELYYLYNITEPNTLTPTTFTKGSIIGRLLPVSILHNTTVSMDILGLENHSNTVALYGTHTLDAFQTVHATIGHQSAPSIKTKTIDKTVATYFDLSYKLQALRQGFSVTIRRFGSGFSTPYADTYPTYGFGSPYANTIQNGTHTGQIHYTGHFSTYVLDNLYVGLDGTLYRDLNGENLGADVTLHLKKALLPDTAYWTYSVGQFIKGNPTTPPSELRMWLGIRLNLGDSDEQG